MKKAVSGLMLTLLMTSMLALMFNIQPLKGEWTGTVYIRADGSIDPPDAPIITYDNVTYILTGKITSSADGIILERGNVIIDGNGYTLQGPALGYGKGFYWSGVNNVTVKNVNVYNFMVAIDVDLSSFNTLSGNNITNNGGGIYLEDSSDNVVSGNNIINNSEGINLLNSPNNSISGNNIRNGIGPDGSGIFLSYSSNNSIFGNNITNNSHGVSLGHCSNNSILGNNIIGITWWGISLCSSDYNSISGNNITNNLVGISLSNASNNNISGNIFVNDGLDVSYYSYGNLVIGNLVNGKPLVYLEGVSDYTITDAGQVILINCELIQVKNLNLSLTTVGIQLWNTHKTTISGNNITNNRCGIELTDSSNNGIFGNNITNNGGGIYLEDSSDNVVSGNNIINNSEGINLLNSPNNSIIGNDIVANNEWGIYLYVSPNSSIFGNNIINNKGYGIGVTSYSSNIRVYHNNFVNNRIQVYNPDFLINIWDDGYPFGGNYWSDFTGVDLCSGPYQNETGSDGIGDSPYAIDTKNTDRYPLMGPFGGLTFKGQNVTAYPSLEVCLIFENVTTGGTTSVNVTSIGPETPSGFKLAGNYYDIKTTADYAGTIKLRIIYDDSNMTLEEEMDLRLMQWDEALQEWVDITTSIDVENNLVVGETTHLSIFAVFTTTPAPPPLSVSISPLSASMIVGQSVSFTSTVSGGTPPYGYQWYLNGNPVSGATSDSWTFTSTTSGTFYVYLKVTDSKGNTAQSETARITVATVPVGGYSVPIQLPTTAKPVTIHIALLMILTAIFIKLKPKTKRKH